MIWARITLVEGMSLHRTYVVYIVLLSRNILFKCHFVRKEKTYFHMFFLPKGKPLLRNGLKQIFRCALVLLKFVFKG